MTKPLLLNIGSGAAKLAAFVNIDIGRGADVRCDVTRGLSHEDSTVDAIYNEHFIEHLSQTEIIRFLRECRRVLKPGGVVRIATPDLDDLIRQYWLDDWREPWLMKYGYEWIRTRAEYININFRSWGHAWLVNEEELTRLAGWAGLVNGVRREWGESATPHLARLETRPESKLIMEYKKADGCFSERPLVSIIVPAFRPDFLKACLDSAMNQTYDNFELLVLDDGAGDTIEKTVRELAAYDSRISYRRNPQAIGEPANLTQGIHLANGVFIKPLYDDDLLESDAIERLVAAFIDAPDVRLAVGRRTFVSAAGNPIKESKVATSLAMKSKIYDGVSVVSEMLSGGINLLGEPTCMLFRRADVLDIDEPNVMSLFGRTCWGVGDVCLAMHLLSGGRLAYVAEPVAKVRIHAGQSQASEGMRERTQLSWTYLRSQGSRLGFNVSRVSILIDKIVKKNAKANVLLKMRRLVFLAWRRVCSFW
jgi:predicted SAM-dependent methyltransferase/glycosyltransferase involved in cell wall biosynthesis